MALSKRILRITIALPQGPVVIDQSLNIRAHISKAALAIQSRAYLDIVGLSKSLRAQLLSQFTLWHKRKVDNNQEAQDWVSVTVEAGYEIDGQEQSTVVFVGEVVFCEPTAPPPNIAIRLTCFTRQVDKTSFISTQSPVKTTYKEFVKWASAQMGLGDNFECDTSFNDNIVENPAQGIYTVSALLIRIQDMYMPAVAAFVDDKKLIVKDLNKIINPDEVVIVKNFVGTPQWTEWGASFTTLFDQSIKLAGGVQMVSLMNPSLNDSTFVITDMDYELSSRDQPFYVTVRCSPSA